MPGPTRFTFLPIGGYRDAAACARHHDVTLWDATVGEGRETESHRDARHAKARAICWGCPVRAKCADDVDVDLDDGVRGGHILPLITTGSRSARDIELLRLLKAGVPLDDAARAADRLLHPRKDAS